MCDYVVIVLSAKVLCNFVFFRVLSFRSRKCTDAGNGQHKQAIREHEHNTMVSEWACEREGRPLQAPL